MLVLSTFLYPHFSVAYSCSILSEPQHVQVHVVFSASPQAEAKAFVVSLQVHRVEFSILREIDHNRERNVNTKVTFVIQLLCASVCVL